MKNKDGRAFLRSVVNYSVPSLRRAVYYCAMTFFCRRRRNTIRLEQIKKLTRCIVYAIEYMDTVDKNNIYIPIITAYVYYYIAPSPSPIIL
jgi:hypothetical protein